jgi:hypothetical protein
MAKRPLRGYLSGAARWLILAGAVTYTLLVAILYLNQRSIMYHPDQSVPDPSAVGLPRPKTASNCWPGGNRRLTAVARPSFFSMAMPAI